MDGAAAAAAEADAHAADVAVVAPPAADVPGVHDGQEVAAAQHVADTGQHTTSAEDLQAFCSEAIAAKRQVLRRRQPQGAV
jgi:hypothetical protein